MTYDLIEPHPAALIESLRAFGYSLRTAIADLIDNSVSAGAQNIALDFHWEGADSYVLLRDDGCGMTSDVLKSAMRPGSQSPTESRDAKDLGRFGLGLKTASFSQCRRLTVSSRARGKRQATRRWDLDYVIKTKEWRLLHEPASGSEDRIPDLARGTIVLWECMDRVVPPGTKKSDEKRKQRYWEMVDELRMHLRLVFHRLLGDSVTITLNGNQLTPWDPFLLTHKATRSLPDEHLAHEGKTVEVKAFILPHLSKLSPTEYQEAGGPKGWAGQQGFYVYRAERLLIGGEWLGLGFQKEEHHRLARIQIDIPNSMDGSWAIDVKKSKAQPPAALRDRLHDLATITRKQSADVFRHRGKIIGKRSAEAPPLWQRKVKGDRVFFTVNREHPLVALVASADTASGRATDALLRLLEETVPAQTIVIDNSERPDCFAKPFEQAELTEVSAVMAQVFRSLRTSAALDAPTAKRRMAAMEFFAPYQELIAQLDDIQTSEES